MSPFKSSVTQQRSDHTIRPCHLFVKYLESWLSNDNTVLREASAQQ